MNVKIETHLPEKIHGVTYVTNTHFLKLHDDAEHELKLNAVGVLRGDCDDCKAELLALERSGDMVCTHCRSSSVKWRWLKLQLAFLPEHESQYMGFAEAMGKNEK